MTTTEGITAMTANLDFTPDDLPRDLALAILAMRDMDYTISEVWHNVRELGYDASRTQVRAAIAFLDANDAPTR